MGVSLLELNTKNKSAEEALEEMALRHVLALLALILVARCHAGYTGRAEGGDAYPKFPPGSPGVRDLKMAPAVASLVGATSSPSDIAPRNMDRWIAYSHLVRRGRQTSRPKATSAPRSDSGPLPSLPSMERPTWT